MGRVTAILVVIAAAMLWSVAAESWAAYDLPQVMEFRNGNGAVQIAIGHDPTIPELFVAINATFTGLGSAASGNVNFGVRSPSAAVGRSFVTMGPADFLHTYTLASTGGTCAAESHLNDAVSQAPVLGARPQRPWRVRGMRRRVQSNGQTTLLEFSLYPFHISSTSSPGGSGAEAAFLEAMFAVGTSVRDSGICDLPNKHDLMRSRFNISVALARYARPYAVWGCAAGVPSLEASQPGVAPCTECNDKWAGPSCSLACDCGNVTGRCGANVSSTTAFCAACDRWRFGPLCASTCNCVQQNTESCIDGPGGTGFCVCKDGFSGARCDDCDSDTFGANCTSKCLCASGICSSGRTGTGACLTCASGFAGRYCNVSCPLACPVGWTCDDGVLGTGNCIPPGGSNPTPAPPPTTTPAPSLAPPVSSIALALAVDIAVFNETLFIDVIARSLSVQPAAVEVVRVVPGSIIVELRLIGLTAAVTQEKYRNLVSMVNAADPSLDAIHPIAAVTSNDGLTFAPGVLPTQAPSNISDTPAPSGSPGSRTPAPLIDGVGGGESDDGRTIIIVGAVLGSLVALSVIGLMAYFFVRSRQKRRAAADDTGADADDEKSPRGERPSREMSTKGGGNVPTTKYAFTGAASSPAAGDDGGSGSDDGGGGIGGASANGPGFSPRDSKGNSLTFTNEDRAKFRRELMGDDDDDGDGDDHSGAASNGRDRGHVIERPTRSPGKVTPRTPATTGGGPSFVPPSPEQQPARPVLIQAAAGAEVVSSAAPPAPTAAFQMPQPSPRQLQQPPLPTPHHHAGAVEQAPSPQSDVLQSPPPPPLPPLPMNAAATLDQHRRVEEARRNAELAMPTTTSASRSSPPPGAFRGAESEDLPGTPRIAEDDGDSDEEEDDTATNTDVAKYSPGGGRNSALQHSGSSPGTSPAASRPQSGSRPGSGKRSAKKCKYCGEMFATAPEVCAVEQRPHRQLRDERKAEKQAKKALKRRLLVENLQMYEQAQSFLRDSDDD